MSPAPQGLTPPPRGGWCSLPHSLRKPQASAVPGRALLNDLGGLEQHGLRDREAERLRRPQVDHHLKTHG